MAATNQNTTGFNASVTLSTSYQQLSALLITAGFTSFNSSTIFGAPVTFRNDDASITIDIAAGYTAAPSTDIGPLPKQVAITYGAGLNAANVWVKAASGTPSLTVGVGAVNIQSPTVTGLASVTVTNNVLAKGSSGDLVDSSITDDGTTVTATEPIVSAHATTPYFETASGKTNTGYLNLKGKTSGAMKFLPADATAQTITIATAAQTSGASTLTIPDQAGVSSNFVFTTLAQTLAGKTLTTPVIGVATGTSLAVTGLLTTSSPTAAFGFVTGAGGAVTQATDKSTTVVSNTNTTAITMNAASLAASTTVSFTFTNSAIAATDQVVVTHQSAGTSAAYNCNAFPGAGSAVISVRNVTLGALAEAIVLRVSVYKAVSA